MPGQNLSNKEKHLLKFWSDPPAIFEQPLLKGITVIGPPELRGIKHLHISFDYPITALCGRNGVGKSTILALAAFSSCRPWDWTAPRWPTRPTGRQPNETAYFWKDFFFHRPSDPLYDGLTIRFIISHRGEDVEFERKYEIGQWSTVPDPVRSIVRHMPMRPIQFVSLSRILPPAESQYVRARLNRLRKGQRIILNDDLVNAMSAIFKKNYSSIAIQKKGAVSLAFCGATENYSGFNMGSGEQAVIYILFAFQRLPAGGLLIVDEIEQGLHPEAQRGLVEELTKLVHRTKKQIIFSTHSSYIIDSLPNIGRILIDRDGSGHRAVLAPTTRFAMASMTGKTNPEAAIYLEDRFTEALVTECLPPDIRRRIDVISIGGSRQVAAQLGAHVRGEISWPALCIFDGDCLDRDIQNWFQQEGLNEEEINYVVLPGEKVPELWVLNELKTEPYLSNFATRMQLNKSEATYEIDRLLNLTDHHSVPYEFAKWFSKTEGVAIADLISPLAEKHPDLDGVREAANSMLR